MLAVTAILSCVITIRGIFKSTKWRHFENVKFEALSARRDCSLKFDSGGTPKIVTLNLKTNYSQSPVHIIRASYCSLKFDLGGTQKEVTLNLKTQ